MNIVVIYHSASGSTLQLVNAFQKQANELIDECCQVVAIEGKDIIEGRLNNETLLKSVDQADAVIFASPTFMGSVSAQFKAFMDASSERWGDQKWRNKFAMGITIGSNFSGDQLNTLQTMQIFANQHGMIWVSIDAAGGYNKEGLNRLGCQTGLVACSSDGALHPQDIKTAQYMARRLIALAQ